MSETPTTDNNDDLDEENVDDVNETPNWEEEATKWKEQAEKWKALSRKNEKTLKEIQQTPRVSGSNEEVIKQLQTALESSKAEIAQFQKQALISETLKLYNLPEEAASLLQGENEEELETSAEALKKLLGGKAKTPVINTQGLNSGEPTEQLSEEEELALYLKNRKKQ